MPNSDRWRRRMFLSGPQFRGLALLVRRVPEGSWRKPAAGASRINDPLGKLAHRNMLLIGGAPEKSRGHGQPERNLEDQLVECGRVPIV